MSLKDVYSQHVTFNLSIHRYKDTYCIYDDSSDLFKWNDKKRVAKKVSRDMNHISS